MFCRKCGTEYEGNFCSNCGTQNSKIEEAKKNIKLDTTSKTVLFLIFFFPAGLIMMWLNKVFNRTARIVITVLMSVMVLFFIASIDYEESYRIENNATIEQKENSNMEKENQSLKDVYEEGLEKGKGESFDDRVNQVEESVDSIKDSIKYILIE